MRSRTGAALAVLAGLVVLAPLLLRVTFFAGDFHAVFEPLRGLYGRELRAGNVLFTNGLGSGSPLLANPFLAAAYPPNFLLALPGVSTASLLTSLGVAHLLWGALGAGLLARSRGASGAASGLAAAVAGFSGIPFAATRFVLLQTTLSWVPWFLLAGARAGRSRSWKGALLLALVCGVMLLAGDPSVAAAALLLLAALELLGPAEPVSRRSRFIRIALGTAGGCLLAAPVLLAGGRALAVSVRASGLPLADVLEWSLHPWELLELALPHPFGNPVRLGAEGYLTPGLQGGLGPNFAALYVGLVPLVLAGVAVARERAKSAGPLVGALALVILALGAHTPVYEAILRLVPVLRSTRFPVRWIALTPLPIALLAATGFDALRSTARGFLRAAGATILVAGAIGAGAFLGLDGLIAEKGAGGAEARVEAVRNAATLRPAVRARLATSAVRGAAIPAVVCLAALLARLRRREAALPAFVVALVFFDELLVAVPLAPMVPASLLSRLPRAAQVILADRPGRVWVDDSAEALAVPTLARPEFRALAEGLPLQRERMGWIVGADFGLPLALNGDLELFAPASYARLRRLVETLPPRERSVLLSHAGVTHVASVLDRGGPGLETLAVLDVGARRPLTVWRNTGALPRVRMVPSLLLYPTEAELLRILREAPDDVLRDAVLVDVRTFGPGVRVAATRPGPAGTRLLSPIPEGTRGISRVAVAEDRGGRLRIRTGGSPGFLVVADTFTPQWTARLDGHPTPILPVDVALRAVLVPGGEHEVVFSYNPWRR